MDLLIASGLVTRVEREDLTDPQSPERAFRALLDRMDLTEFRLPAGAGPEFVAEEHSPLPDSLLGSGRATLVHREKASWRLVRDLIDAGVARDSGDSSWVLVQSDVAAVYLTTAGCSPCAGSAHGADHRQPDPARVRRSGWAQHRGAD
jgi:hypothetical protein